MIDADRLALDADRVALDADRLAFDSAHVWHPYSSMPASLEPLLVDSARGTRLLLADGREIIDAMSSWWAAIHGYRHPVLDAAIRSQLDAMSHVMFGGLTHRPAIDLAAKLVEITAAPLECVFFSDSGSVAVEVAAKMALQYWVSAGKPEKHRLITWRGGYHGDTVHPMSVCDPEGGMHSLWRGLLPQQLFLDAPPPGFDTALDEAYLESWDRALDQHAGEIAAIIVEPVVQGAGGMTFHNPGYLVRLRELADRHDVLLIFDEIATGFGRTGALFAADHAAVVPDICCLGKAMTGGYLSMAATLCTARVARRISSGQVPVLAHGPTFMGNPLAAAVALASIDVLLTQDWAAEVARLEQALRRQLAPVSHLTGVRDVRVLGAIGVVQLETEVDVAAATAASVEHGVWLRPFRDLIYTMPPYITTDAEVEQIAAAVDAAVRASTGADDS
jgi:adenosylmethionine-8-amino-7-oxononanoate aminotransferase